MEDHTGAVHVQRQQLTGTEIGEVMVCRLRELVVQASQEDQSDLSEAKRLAVMKDVDEVLSRIGPVLPRVFSGKWRVYNYDSLALMLSHPLIVRVDLAEMFARYQEPQESRRVLSRSELADGLGLAPIEGVDEDLDLLDQRSSK